MEIKLMPAEFKIHLIHVLRVLKASLMVLLLGCLSKQKVLSSTLRDCRVCNALAPYTFLAI